ncbi:MAG TPA: FHA domain-containing protein, partial [Pseudonocardia sp.]|nr:FHA domain-containing protein [Pseudonocardia sp.]
RPQGRADDLFADLHDLRAGTVPGRGVVLATASAARHVAVPPLPAAAPAEPDRANAVAPAAASAPPPGAPAVRPAAASSAPPPPSAPPSAPAVQQPSTSPSAASPVPPASPPAVRAAMHAEPTHGRPVPDEEPIEMTVSDGSGPPPIPPAPRSEEPPRRAPRRSALIDKAPAPAQRAPLTPGRPLSPARGGARPDGQAPRVPAAPRDRDESPVVEGPRTRGHLCARGHLNDPRSHFCVLCGIRMNERTGELVFGARPPLGLLVFDDGATYTVDAEYLVGRMPDVDERVRNGSLRSIVVEDRSGAVSRVHAEVRVDGWDVMLVDSRSRNGTHVAGPGANTWTTVPSGRSHRLTPGTRVRLGSRTFLFESPSGVR